MKVQRILSKRRDEIIVMVQERGVEKHWLRAWMEAMSGKRMKKGRWRMELRDI